MSGFLYDTPLAKTSVAMTEDFSIHYWLIWWPEEIQRKQGQTPTSPSNVSFGAGSSTSLPWRHMGMLHWLCAPADKKRGCIHRPPTGTPSTPRLGPVTAPPGSLHLHPPSTSGWYHLMIVRDHLRSRAAALCFQTLQTSESFPEPLYEPSLCAIIQCSSHTATQT